MTPTVTVAIPATSEALVRRLLALHEGLHAPALSAPGGTVLDARETAVIDAGRAGVTELSAAHAPGDGAGWIWKGVGRVLPGCAGTWDVYHAGGRVSGRAQRVFGEGTAGARAAFERGRDLLPRARWPGVCAWAGELLAAGKAQEQSRRRKAAEELLAYFAEHTQRLDYRERLASGRGDRQRRGRGAGQDAGVGSEGSGCPVGQEERAAHGQPRLRPELHPVGRLLEPGRLTPRESGCTRGSPRDTSACPRPPVAGSMGCSARSCRADPNRR